MLLLEKNGVCLSAGREIFVDATGVQEQNVLVTHAHSDHCRLTSSNSYFMTPETLALASPKKNVNVQVKEFGEKFMVNGFDVSMHPSGHILGSAQLAIANGVEAVITSDFKLQESLLLKPAEILPCEVLLIETTFGLREFSFPPREEVYTEMAKWAKEKIASGAFVVLAGYATGKAQELTRFSNDYLSTAPLVHSSVFEKNMLAKKAGARLGDFVELDHNLGDSSVLIIPPSLLNNFLLEALSMQLGKKVECAVATGWKRSRFKTFPLSDHADFNQLCEYVKNAQPKLVLTHHGFDREFASSVTKEFGIPARPLSEAGQKTLSEFLNQA
ncbi:MAG: hypothetical protein HY392_02960 [Candidatus Diapherotrites archaeon]|nr:hypothetical protein [Candidatus Diapherotrites archaeon]